MQSNTPTFIRMQYFLNLVLSGFYYFIFSNENEITSNFVAANFDMHKTVFDVANSEEQCSNTTDCSLPLNFFSQQHVVIEVRIYNQKNTQLINFKALILLNCRFHNGAVKLVNIRLKDLLTINSAILL